MMQHQNVDLDRLFHLLDVIVCSLIECRDATNTLYFLTVGYWGGQILIKVYLEEDISIYRFELDSLKDAKQRVEWVIDEKKLVAKVVTYFFDDAKANISSDFYSDNQIQYTFDARSRSSEPIKVSYKLHLPDIDFQRLCDSYHDFLELLNQNERGLKILEVSPHPNKFLRKSKLLDLLAD